MDQFDKTNPDNSLCQCGHYKYDYEWHAIADKYMQCKGNVIDSETFIHKCVCKFFRIKK